MRLEKIGYKLAGKLEGTLPRLDQGGGLAEGEQNLVFADRLVERGGGLVSEDARRNGGEMVVGCSPLGRAPEQVSTHSHFPWIWRALGTLCTVYSGRTCRRRLRNSVQRAPRSSRGLSAGCQWPSLRPRDAVRAACVRPRHRRCRKMRNKGRRSKRKEKKKKKRDKKRAQ